MGTPQSLCFGEPLHGGGYALFNKMKGVILCSFQIYTKGVVRYELLIRTFIVCLLHTAICLPSLLCWQQ